MPVISDILPQLLFVANIAAITLSVTSINAFYTLSLDKYKSRNAAYLSKKYQSGEEFEFHFEPHMITGFETCLFCISEIILFGAIFITVLLSVAPSILFVASLISLFLFGVGVVVLFGIYVYLWGKGCKDLSKVCGEVKKIQDSLISAP